MKYLITTSVITAIISWLLFLQTAQIVFLDSLFSNLLNDTIVNFLLLQPFLSTAFTFAAWLLNNKDFSKFVPFLSIVSIISFLGVVAYYFP